MASCFVESAEDFVEKAKELYLQDPDKTRFAMKYTNNKSELILKATDDKVCIKYRTDQEADVLHIEKLNAWVFAVMSGLDPNTSIMENEVAENPSSPRGKKKKGGKGKK